VPARPGQPPTKRRRDGEARAAWCGTTPTAAGHATLARRQLPQQHGTAASVGFQPRPRAGPRRNAARRTQRPRGDRARLANQPRHGTRTNLKVPVTPKRVIERPNDLHQHQEGTLGYRSEPKHTATKELDFTERTRQHGLAKLSHDLRNTKSRVELRCEFAFQVIRKAS
jgi:hypothetical protein